MPVTFQDYYDTLGVSRTATQDEIQAAYRKLARKHHPDVSKAAGAEEKFKQVGEAYEVLKDPEKRKKYDALGQNWKTGQEFNPPPGWQSYGGGQRPGGVEYDFGSGADFSDFFEQIFGGGGFGGERSRRTAYRARGQDVEAELSIPLEDAYRGATRTISLRRPQVSPDGQVREETQSYEVKIPAGSGDGTVLRLSGQGGAGVGGAEAGDLFVRIRIAPHHTFTLRDRDLTVEVPVAPWEAALGAEIPVPTLDGNMETKLPAGTGCGKKLRLRGQGMPDRKGARADLYASIRIEVPKHLTDKERELWEELRDTSDFDPRRK